ncbi:LOW QUALITY PROTEIN: hypothetical protein CVT26_002399 [Gymnopilus dilepis]|uniref:F-box domain-containing protein n=1 Tax=Gymnopilus dilepis TaxID=231916 RepID=A0A409Y3M8_9AGAR|nr:LOW QUALITY PROTEIN: hypothetical protein CVT26_002399 [Gymnopilus dilepis]
MEPSSFESFLLRSSSAVLCRILQQADVLSLVSLSRTSKTLHAIYRWFAEKAWDPNWRYRQYFAHVHAFRRLLRRCDALVSGSFALQYFERKRYINSDMDIYLRTGGVIEMCDWLKKEGYRCTDRGAAYGQASRTQHVIRAVTSRGPEHGPLLGVYSFQRMVATIEGHVEVMKIQLIVVDTSPIEHILFEFHSSERPWRGIRTLADSIVLVLTAAVMNFLSADEAISIFPMTTFEDRTSFVSHLRSTAERHCAWKRKYRKRGFDIVADQKSRSVSRLVLGCRTVGDRHCWRIKFRDTVLPDGGRGYYNNPSIRIPFEVWSADMGIVSEGCSIKIADTYVWR